LYHVNIKMLIEKFETEVCIYQHKRGKRVTVWYKNNNTKLVTSGWEKCNFKNVGWDRKIFQHRAYYVFHSFHTLYMEAVLEIT